MAQVAIIPARGGSKRVPGKNIRMLAGKPLIAWTIDAALESKCFDHVIVSTDDLQIASVAELYGAEVPFIRPEELSSDTATSDDVIKHAVGFLELNSTVDIETIALLQPTSPLRSAKQIRESFELYNLKQADAVVSVAECNVKIDLCNTLPTDYSLANFLKEKAKRTQDMHKLYELNGAIYLFKRKLAGEMTKLYSRATRSFAYVMEKEDSVDIDTELDFKWSEFLFKMKE